MRSIVTAGAKKRMVSRLPRIGTHDGTFHCDEALGCWMLKRTEQFKDAEITRTRKEEVLKELDAVLDVGGVYDAEHHRFDHHQKGFGEVFGHGHTIKLSSAGLVYKHFGKEILKNVLQPMQLGDQEVDSMFLKVYKGFVEAIDAIDNGVNPCAENSPVLYSDSTGLSSRVSRLNPAWNEKDSDIDQHKQFDKAMQLCGQDFSDYVFHVAKRWLPARTYVQSAFTDRFSIASSGEIIAVEIPCPWKEHLLDLEVEHKVQGQVKYCVYGEDEDYRVQAVPISLESFASRLPLPEQWRALRGSELDGVSGIEGCVFVHVSGFIGGHKTKEGALAMAEKALALAKKPVDS